MSPSVPTFLHFRRMMPMAAAARFGAFRNLFHHHREEDNNNLISLRHASAMSSAILKNISTALAEPSQMVDPSTDNFEETHRHYSFITVLAIMSLFILITVSIVALILGFCRKSNSVFALGGSQDKTAGQGDEVSQFELDSLDIDSEDVETKVCRDDPTGACYYHLSDDDNHGMDESDNECLQIEDIKNKKEKAPHMSRHLKSNQKPRQPRKQMKLKFRNSKYYYNLHDEGEDDSDSGWGHDCQRSKPDKESHQRGDESTPLNLPRRSTTFPQLHNVLTSCIRGETHQPPLGYQRLMLRPSLPNTTTEIPDNLDNPHLQCESHNISKLATDDFGSATPKIFHSDATDSSVICHSFHTLDSHPYKNSQIVKPNKDISPPTKTNDSPALLYPETVHIHHGKPNTPPVANQASISHKCQQGQPNPTPHRGHLIKSYSLHDISHIPNKRSCTRHSPKRPKTGHSMKSAAPTPRQVMFKVGPLVQNADIPMHHKT